MTDHIKTGTTESLGIKLTAQDVADAIATAVEPSWLRRAIHQVYFPSVRRPRPWRQAPASLPDG